MGSGLVVKNIAKKLHHVLRIFIQLLSGLKKRLNFFFTKKLLLILQNCKKKKLKKNKLKNRLNISKYKNIKNFYQKEQDHQKKLNKMKTKQEFVQTLVVKEKGSKSSGMQIIRSAKKIKEQTVTSIQESLTSALFPLHLFNKLPLSK